MPKSTEEYYRYLAIGAGDRDWGLCVTGCGYQPAAPGHINVPSRPHPSGHFYQWETGRVLQEFAIIYITRGQGEFESTSSGQFNLVAGNLFILFPGEWHRYRADAKTGWGVYWVHFLGEIANNLRDRGLISPERPILNTDLDESLLEVFVRLLDEMRKDPAGLQQIAAANVLEILARATGAVRAQRHLPHLQGMVNQVKLLLEEDPNNLPVVDDLIAGLDVSRTHFFRIFKTQTGLTPYQYHLQLKIRRAAEMLRNSDHSIKRVALALKFQNQYHFSRLFAQKMGMSPTAFRKLGAKAIPSE